MWIPTPLYERLPQFWFLMGLLFISNGLYLGLDFELAFGYFGIGLASCCYGMAIAVWRLSHRTKISDEKEGVDLEAPTPI